MTTTNEQAANKAWDILVRLARDKEAITYSDLADKIGVGKQETDDPLELILTHCMGNKIPRLTVLVVYKTGPQKGRPGGGYTVNKSVPEDSYAVYMHDWTKEPKPNF